MARYLPSELRCMIYGYISNVDVIDKIIKNLIKSQPIEIQRLRNCIMALLTSKQWTVTPEFVLSFPNLNIVTVPVAITKGTDGTKFARIPDITFRYIDRVYLDSALIIPFLNQYCAHNGNLTNRKIEFIDSNSSFIVDNTHVINNGLIGIYYLYNVVYSLGGLRSLTTWYLSDGDVGFLLKFAKLTSI